MNKVEVFGEGGMIEPRITVAKAVGSVTSE